MTELKNHYRTLGKTGIRVSPLGLGTVKFGRNQGLKYPASFALPEMAQLADLLACAKTLGINLMDTAPAYGLAEARLGELLAGQRQDWIITTKAGEQFVGGQSVYDFTSAALQQSLENSLRTLRTDYVDILQIHATANDGQLIQQEEILNWLQDIKAKGMARAVGWSAYTLEAGLRAAELLDVVMVGYSPAYTANQPVLDKATETGCGVLLKRVLDSGHLKLPPAEIFQKIMALPTVSSAIIGTINPVNLQTNAAAISQALGQLERASQ